MEVIKVKDVEELERVLYSTCATFDYYREMMISVDELGGDLIITRGKPYYISDMNILVIEGIYEECSEDGHEAEWCLTLVYDWNGKRDFDIIDAMDYSMFEQNTPIGTIYNYMKIMASTRPTPEPLAA